MPKERQRRLASRAASGWRRVCLLLICATGLPGSALALDLSIDQARSALQGSSDKLRAAGEDIQRRELDAKAAETLSYPDLQIGLNQVYGRKDIDISPVPIIGAIAPASVWTGLAAR